MSTSESFDMEALFRRGEEAERQNVAIQEEVGRLCKLLGVSQAPEGSRELAVYTNSGVFTLPATLLFLLREVAALNGIEPKAPRQ